MTNEQAASAFRFAISATFTADPLRPTILFWGRQLQVQFQVRFAPYNQLPQTLLDPQSEFGDNAHGINVILARLEDFGQTAEKIEQNVTQLLQELHTAAARLNASILFCLCPSSPSFALGAGFDKHMRMRISSAVADTTGVQYIDYCDIERLYPVDAVHDVEGERLGKIPYTDIYYCALGTMLVRHAHALNRPPYKVIALDCDNTLWKGICGEDGPEGVVLDAPRRALHESMLEQREAGVLLTLASKNNESDVTETFAAHPEMPLQLRHFTAWRLNWDPKADNLAQLAEELGLGLDSFVFIDDNPKECAEVQQAIPEVLALALPQDVDRIPRFLQHVWVFDHSVITEEDRNRSVYYRQQQEFGSEVKRAESLEHFMATLDLRVTVNPLAPEKLARVAQLTQRTNQFNFTTIRRTEAETQSLLASGYECFTVDASDRFGDYGLVGVLIVKAESDELQVDTFLLSCRALGRGVEHRMLAFLGQNASSRGLHTVVLNFTPTQKNLPVRQFLDTNDLTQLRLPASDTADFKWKPPIAATSAAPERAVPKPVKHPRKADYQWIADELSTARDILTRIREERRPAQQEGLTEVESKLAVIWAELLERNSIGRGDNFFDIGGHSLLAVLLLLRIREAFGVELSIDDVYSGTLTLADLATRIEAVQMAGIDPEEYASLLAEIENMSDEQARELLEREQAE